VHTPFWLQQIVEGTHLSRQGMDTRVSGCFDMYWLGIKYTTGFHDKGNIPSNFITARNSFNFRSLLNATAKRNILEALTRRVPRLKYINASPQTAMQDTSPEHSMLQLIFIVRSSSASVQQ
jgi:hypothetical protein